MAARTGRALLAGVIGFPVGHSLSPALQEYWLRSYDIDGAYIPLEVPSGAFNDTLRLLSSLRFRGANVTIPYKEQAFAAASQLDEAAQLTGAVNTLIRLDDGSYLGKNTDVTGFMAHLVSSGVDPRALDKAVILGAGGAARAIASGLALAGCKEIYLCNRTGSNAERLISDLAPKLAATLGCHDWEDRAAALEGADLLVNTTQLGMTGQPALEIALDALPSDAAIADIVYKPLETELLKEARKRGHATIDGLGMLLHQAVPGFEAWYGVAPAVTPELHDYIASLAVA